MTRLVNRLLGLVFGAALLAGGVLVIVEGAWTWTNSGFVVIPGTSWLSTFETTRWSAPIVIAISVAVAVLGGALLLFEVRPHPKRLIDFRTDGDTEWALVRRSAERHLQRRIARQVPASPVNVHLTPRRGRWTLDVRARAAAATAPALEQAGRDELDALHAPASARVKVRTTGTAKATS